MPIKQSSQTTMNWETILGKIGVKEPVTMWLNTIKCSEITLTQYNVVIYLHKEIIFEEHVPDYRKQVN